ncbi:aminoglycoside phosphotransferase family protein [Franzmannia qiaohouensis]|uniref:Phosphotransferase n=1 Tax=Franzmannia qiaohouensis TaxID=1329370 RepID=A0ABU1HAY1_9GAMM|nr:phosphotransferase [Halomonas qiaohouensis]MDR5904614.1 phosphotransferase [Halomonas qiaohouensis]
MPHTPRLTALANWSAARHGLAAGSVDLQLAAGDASFRRYYRLRLPDGTTRMLMDAPPAQEDSAPFLRIAEQWRDAGLPVPRVHAADLEQGFLELDDLGDAPLNARLSDAAYDDAETLLDALQNQAPLDGLPAYDAALLGRELDLFPEWCLARVVDLAAPVQWPVWRQRLIEMALAQPRVAVHRDFDAMNLMCHREQLYVIDFQDAVAGPLSYDLISLLRGRYRRFDLDDFGRRCEAFRQRALADGRLTSDEGAKAFRRQVDAMAAQRCLKVLGIFCRLTLRDHKAGYLARLPHFVAHLEDSLAPHAEFAALADWLQGQFQPALTSALQARDVEAAYQ